MAQRRNIASNQTRGFRQIDTRAINQDNTQATIDLPRGPHIESAIVRISGTINVGTLFAGGVRAAAPYAMMRRADWVLNSNVTLDSVSGFQLSQLYVTRRAVPSVTNPLAAAGATSFDVSFLLDRSGMDMVRPKDSLLKTDVGVSNNQLRLQLGALADMYGNGAGAATYTNVQMSTSIIDYQEAFDDANNTPKPSFYLKRNGQRFNVPSAGSGVQVKINTGNRLRMVSIRVLNATTFEPDVSLLTRVRVQRAGDTRVDMTVQDMLRLNGAAYGVVPMVGQVVLDMANPGYIRGVTYSEFWPIPSSADTYLLVDTSAACILEIATIEGVDLT